jgi:type IVB pilus formation R64 PilN family outer membrane protein
MFYKRIFLLFFLVTLFVSGCNNPVYYQTEKNVADVKQRITTARKISDNAGKPVPSLVVNQGLYVDRTPINLNKDPSWLKNKIILRGDQLPFSYYSRTIAGGGGHNILTRYQVGLDEAAMVSMNYSGTVRGALDLLAAKSGYVYVVSGNSIYWQAYVTKTFDIAFMPGSSDYMMGKASGGSGASSAQSNSSTGTTVQAMIDDSSAAQYSNLKGTLSVWKDLATTIKQLLSPNGTVIVSESTTTVTVRDRPSNLNLVAKYIANLNANLSRQVLVKVQVLDVSLLSDFVWGINWNVVKQTLGQQFTLQSTEGTPVSISSLAGGAIPEFGTKNNKNYSTAVGALIDALTQQGKVSVVTEPRVVCLNNQVSVIRIVSQEGYLASVQNTTVAGTSGGSSSYITSQLTPGALITGLTLYVLPKILGDKVFLQVNADLSTKVSIQSISSATGTTPSDTSTTPGSIIQVPNFTQKQFNQRSVIGSGDTLIISGYRQLSNTANAMQLMNSQAMGGKGSKQVEVETIVLITPIILHGYA